MAITKVTRTLLSTGIDDQSNATAITINSSENVGIGTTSPSQILHVKAASPNILLEGTSFPSLKWAGTDLTADAEIYYGVSGLDWNFNNYNNGRIVFKTNNTERLRITEAGLIGIGTTSPTEKLTVNGALAITGALADDRTSTAAMDFSGGVTRFISYGASGTGGIFAFRTASGGASSTERMRINSSGCVGIGSTADRSLGTNIGTLVVNGSAGGGLWLSTGDSSATTSKIISTIDGSVGDLLINQGSGVNGGNIRFSLNDSEKMRILSSGTLLVSTTTASGLSNGTSNTGHSFGGGQQVNATNNDTNLILNMSNGSSNPHVQFRSDGGNTGSITTNGSSVAYNAGSDYRLKENVIPLKDGLDRLNKLNPVQFDWKKSQETDEGFIAHEVQEIVPYVVKGEKDGEEIQTMDYGKLTPLLVKAIQEQQTIIDDLKTRIETLENA
jgi:hypothetical protein